MNILLENDTPEEKSRYAWMALRYHAKDDVVKSTLSGCDLMADKIKGNFITQILGNLETDFEAVPEDQLYELSKNISQTMQALDRYVKIMGDLPEGKPGELCRALFEKNQNLDFPHIRSKLLQTSLETVASRTANQTAPKPKL